MERPRVLLVGIPPEHAEAIRRASSRRGWMAVPAADSGAAGPAASWALCVLGADDDVGAAASRLRDLRRSLGGCPVVVLGRQPSLEAAVRFMRSGAVDVMAASRPPEELAERALAHADAAGPAPRGDGLAGASAAIGRVRQRMRAVARTGSTVLLTGETGCGKGVVARAIHRLSERRSRPFVHVDCAALATSVIDSELFGHERGAFTGAVDRRAGRFERAEGGTVFLDEIGDLEPSLQSKLLRILQDRQYERLGGGRTRAMTARVIAATNRDLAAEVARGRFRADLWFRIRVFEIGIPPLRQRREDVPALVRALLPELAAKLRLPAPSFSPGFARRLAEHAWPGNVRELMNLLERLLIEGEGGPLDEASLDGWPERGAETASWGAAFAASAPSGAPEREAIAAALRAEGGNVTRAARRLGLARSTLRYRMRQHGL
jgi:two-component system response regulator HydG